MAIPAGDTTACLALGRNECHHQSRLASVDFFSTFAEDPSETGPKCIRRRSILRLRLAVALILPFACSVPNPAIAQPRDLTQYTHTAWRTREVPMKYGISRMAQTPDGYLWLGAYDGIYRFDGVRFARWEPPNGQQLPKQYITSLTVTRDGTLWIGATEGLASWKDGKLTRFDYGKRRGL